MGYGGQVFQGLEKPVASLSNPWKSRLPRRPRSGIVPALFVAEGAPMRSICLAWLGFAGLALAAPQEDIRLAGPPDVSPDGKQIVFAWKGDIWLAPTAGGAARLLASHPAGEEFPKFSPDGREVAFNSERAGGWMIFSVPTEGGVPQQLTWHTEGNLLLGWYPDGRSLLTRATRDGNGFNPDRLYRIERGARAAEKLVFDDYAGDAAVSPDGERILFTREGHDSYRLGYHGSRASQLWLFEGKTGTFKKLTDSATDCRAPVWKPDGRGFYYTDARDGVANLFERDLDSKKARQLTKFTDSHVMFPALSRDGSMLVFRQLFDFYRLPTDGKRQPEKIALTSATDLPGRAPEVRRRLKSVLNETYTGTLDFTSGGLEMAFTAGGNVWVMDTVLRDPQPVTTGSAFSDGEAVFAPDGTALYFLRDTGEGVNIFRAKRRQSDQFWWQNEQFSIEPLTGDTASRSRLAVSPDGKQLACVRGRGEVVVCDANGKNARTVATSPIRADCDWAPDGKWLLCTLMDSGDNTDVWIVSADGQTRYNLSRRPGWSGDAAWSPDGKLVAFVNRTLDKEVSLHYVWLARADQPWSKREATLEQALKKMKEARVTRKTGAAPAAESKPRPKVEVKIDFEGLAERVQQAKLPENAEPHRLFWSFDSLALAFCANINGKAGTYRLNFPNPGEPTFMTALQGTQARWIEKGSKVLWLVDGVPAAFEEKYPFEALQTLDWREHLRLGFRKGWRLLRDYFYDPRMNNRDWDGVRRKYEDMAANAPDMNAFRRVMQMMEGELNASHMGFTVASQHNWTNTEWKVRTAHLGLRFDRAFAGPGLKVSEVLADGPTDTPRCRVQPGEVVVSMDGTEVGPATDLTTVLNGSWPRELLLEIRGSNSTRKVNVPTISFGEARELMHKAWVQANRKRVNTMSGEKLGYLHIERMTLPSLRQFEREVYAEGVGKDGLIIDVRNNPGGFISDKLLAILCHPYHAMTIPRDGELSYPAGYLGRVVYNKPIVVLCNQNSASNAEIFSRAIQTLKRGKLVGVPTCGAVISTPDRHLLDLGSIRLPDRGWYGLNDGADMELNGVVPDYIIWPQPGELAAGKDTQLEKGVQVLRDEVKADQAKKRPTPLPASQRKK
jgi:tricorn protease